MVIRNKLSEASYVQVWLSETSYQKQAIYRNRRDKGRLSEQSNKPAKRQGNAIRKKATVPGEDHQNNTIHRARVSVKPSEKPLYQEKAIRKQDASKETSEKAIRKTQGKDYCKATCKYGHQKRAIRSKLCASMVTRGMTRDGEKLPSTYSE